MFIVTLPCTADFNGDGDIGTDADIEAFFGCWARAAEPGCFEVTNSSTG
ncbi:MAG TPA: hypothetical protein VD997_16870 [Phycisphaerales bacterium]|nr:hypothetical protein [Phycisphaerales bacterium]